MKVPPVLLILAALTLPALSQNALYGFQLHKVVSDQGSLPIVKVSYQVFTQAPDGTLVPEQISSKDHQVFRKMVAGNSSLENEDRIVWKFKVKKRYGLLAYRMLTREERKQMKLKAGIYLIALDVTEDIFQDEELKKQILEAEEATSLESLLSQSVDEINATLEEKGGMDNLVSEMYQQEFDFLTTGENSGYFLPVRRKH